MNGEIKWHKPTGPAFAPGEEWVSTCGFHVKIISVRKYPTMSGDHIGDYAVLYEQSGGAPNHEKDAWNFQVRYTHVADLEVRKGLKRRSQESCNY